MAIPRAKLKRIGSYFDQIHIALAYLRDHIDATKDPDAEALYTQLEYGTLAPMRRLRKHLKIPYNWQETPEYQQEVGNDGPRNTDSDRELLCTEGS